MVEPIRLANWGRVALYQSFPATGEGVAWWALSGKVDPGPAGGEQTEGVVKNRPW